VWQRARNRNSRGGFEQRFISFFDALAVFLWLCSRRQLGRGNEFFAPRLLGAAILSAGHCQLLQLSPVFEGCGGLQRDAKVGILLCSNETPS
jgi:hypothetical protein